MEEVEQIAFDRRGDPAQRLILQPGMVFTIDPGIHYPDPKRDLPIAIEDVLVVTEDGYDLLTTYTTKVIT